MNSRWIVLATVILLLIGYFGVALWWFSSAEIPLLPRVPEREAHRPYPESEPIAVDLQGQFQRFDGQPSTQLRCSWPRFRGTAFDNIAADPFPLLESWSSNGPPILWSIELGEGYAGPAVANGCVYLLDYDEQQQGDSLRCFSFDDGREIWRRTYRVKIKRNHGISRTVPAVTERFVVTIGPKCHVLCCDAHSGEFLWGIDMVSKWSTQIPLWYTGQCPLLDNELAILAPCGSVLLVAVDCASGNVVWQTPNEHSWQMSHSSVVPMVLNGRRMFVYAAVGGLVGVSADGEDRGRILWKATNWTPKIVAPSPVVLDDGRVFVTAGYGAGSAMFRVNETNGSYTVQLLYTLERTVFACEQHTPIHRDGFLYAVLPPDAGIGRGQLACLAADGTLKWRSGREERFGLGPFLMAGENMMFLLEDSGILTLARTTPDGYIRLARARVLQGQEAWAPMALADGRLLIRDSTRLVCLDVRGK